MENLLPALILPLVIALMVWLGLRSRKSAIAGYEDDKQRYTATATMTVTDIRQEDVERWEEQEDDKTGGSVHGSLFRLQQK